MKTKESIVKQILGLYTFCEPYWTAEQSQESERRSIDYGNVCYTMIGEDYCRLFLYESNKGILYGPGCDKLNSWLEKNQPTNLDVEFFDWYGESELKRVSGIMWGKAECTNPTLLPCSGMVEFTYKSLKDPKPIRFPRTGMWEFRTLEPGFSSEFRRVMDAIEFKDSNPFYKEHHHTPKIKEKEVW